MSITNLHGNRRSGLGREPTVGPQFAAKAAPTLDVMHRNLCRTSTQRGKFAFEYRRLGEI